MPEEKRPLKVFLSYASQDKPVVREFSGRLASEGWIDPWVDEKKLLPGHDWRTKIEEAVESSDVVIICLSSNSVTKEGFVQKELRYAREIAFEKPDETIFLIPLRLDECTVPRGLRFYQWGDYYGENKEETYNALLESLKLRHEQKLKLEVEEYARREKVEKERLALEEKTRKEAEEKSRLEAEGRAQWERDERERKAAEANKRKEAEENARRETEERARIEKVEKERKAAEIALQEKKELEAAQKAKREKAEREATEKAKQEKLKRDATEKAKRERAERQAAQITALKETLSKSFIALKSNLPKAVPFFRIAGIAGIAIALFWVGSWGVPKLTSLIPTTIESTITSVSLSLSTTSTLDPTVMTATSSVPRVTATSTLPPSPIPSPTMDASCISGNKPLQVAWSSDGSMMAVTSLAGVYIFDANNYSLLKFLSVNNSTGGISFDPISDSLYVTTNDKVLKMRLNTGEIIQTFDEEANIVDTAIVSQDGKKLLVSTDNGLITIWDVTSGKIWKENKSMFISEDVVFSDIRHVVASPDFAWVATVVDSYNNKTGYIEGSLVFWYPNSDTTGTADSLTYSGARWLATTGLGDLIAYNDEPGGRVSIIRAKNLSAVRTFVGESPFTFSSDGKSFAYVRWTGTGWEIWLANPEGQNIALFTPSTTPSTPTSEEAERVGYGYSGVWGPRPNLNIDGSQLILIWGDTLEIFDTTEAPQKSFVLLNRINDQLCIKQ